MSGKYVLREACADDCRTIHNLLQEFTMYDKKPEEYKNDMETLRTDLEQGWYKCIVADYIDSSGDKKGIIGFVLYTFGYDGWKGRVLNITDLYISKEHRATKLGHLFILRLCLIAQSNKAIKMCGIVSDWNIGARRFYSAFGATDYSTEVSDDQKQHYFAAQSDAITACVKKFSALYARCEYDDSSSSAHVAQEQLRKDINT